MNRNFFEFAEIRKIQLNWKTLLETEGLHLPGEMQPLRVFGIRIRSDGAREAESLLFTDSLNKSVKCLSLRTGVISSVYKSEWHVINVYELDDRKGMLLLELSPKLNSLFSLFSRKFHFRLTMHDKNE